MRDQLQQDAKTMTCKQMAEKYGTTSENMRDRLYRRGIECQRVRINWSARIDELKEAAARMTPQGLAEHFGVSTTYVYVLLQRHKIKALAAEWPARFAGGLEALKQLAPSMTVAELAAHFGIQARTVRLNLKRLGMECKGVERAPRTPAVKVERPAIKKQPKPAPRAKPAPVKARTPKPEPAIQRKPSTAPVVKRKVEIIMPADAKITIADFRPPPGARICNGSSTQTYNPRERAISVRSGY